MAAVSVFFVAIAALVFGLIAWFGDIRRLLGAMSSEAN
jgi:putative spermidine/putrescine transport system permease protein